MGNDARPIGMFDSGFGGLTVARALIDLLPRESLVYFGDTARYPYGPRSAVDVATFAHQITDLLVSQHDVKAVVVACNTASAAALSSLQSSFDVPIFGVIEPGVRASTHVTSTQRVGVIGTVTTIGSGAYQRAFAEAAPAVDLVCAACPGFVEFVERGELNTDQALILAERLLAPVVDAGVDTLLLGCTHYPFLARTISRVMGRDVTLVSSADETAFDVLARSVAGDLSAAASVGDALAPAHRWISSGDVSTFERLGRSLLGPELVEVEPHSWTT